MSVFNPGAQSNVFTQSIEEQKNKLGYVDPNPTVDPTQNNPTVNINSEPYNSEEPEPDPVDPIETKSPIRDVRLAGVYDIPFAIGNDMPVGETFKGIPSIMNQHALIRFEGIAGSNQHIDVYDFSGNFKVRNARTYNMCFNLSDAADESGESGLFTKNADGTVTYNGTDENLRNKIQGKTLMADENSGDIYYEEQSKTRVVYETKKKETTTNRLINGSRQYVVDFGSPSEANKAPQYLTDAPAIDHYASDLGLVRQNEQTKNLLPLSQTKWTLLSLTKAEDVKDVDPEQANKQVALKITEMDQTAKEYVKVGFEKSKVFLNRESSESITYSHVIEPSTENLCNPEMWVGDEQFMYDWTDFMYCTNQGEQASNNYLITLRRFPMPVWDSGKIVDQDSSKQFMTPIARAVTWVTDDDNKLSSVLGMDWKYNWKDLEASVNEVQDNSTNQGEDLEQAIPGLSKLGKVFEFINGPNEGERAAQEEYVKYDPYQNGPLANQPKGPVNSITKTKMRDVGLEFTNTITLKFNYSLYSLGSINSQKAALDIIANMLSLTYSNAGFWGGANRFFKNVHDNYFSNDRSMMSAFNKGDFGGLLTSFKSQFDTAFSKVGDFLTNLVSDPKKALEGLLNKGAKHFLQTASAKQRPGVLGFKSLLTGEPVGEWHLVIGNPFNPIAMIGNLIVTSCKFEFADGQLGPDDFPHEMSFTITLEHGKPRDKGDIESIFNKGQGRLHYSYRGQTEPWNISPDTKKQKKRGKFVSKDKDLKTESTDSDVNQNLDPNVTYRTHPINTGIFINRRTMKQDIVTDTEYWKNIYNRLNVKNMTGAVDSYKQAGKLGFKNTLEDRIVKAENSKTKNK